MIDKRTKLQSSTLGNLISILAKHDIAPGDLHYLKWVKAKRDFFVHRFFHQGGWPGELGNEEIKASPPQAALSGENFREGKPYDLVNFRARKFDELPRSPEGRSMIMNLDLFESE